MTTLFTKIIRGDLPCYKIQEDEHTFSFLALHQVQLGHTIVVPKVEIDSFLDVPEPYYSAVFQSAQKIARALKAATGCTRIGTSILGWEVPHFHYHLVPMKDPGDLDFRVQRARTKEEMVFIQNLIQKELGT